MINQEAGDSDRVPTSDRNVKSRAILGRQANGIIPDQVSYLQSFRVSK